MSQLKHLYIRRCGPAYVVHYNFVVTPIISWYDRHIEQFYCVRDVGKLRNPFDSTDNNV